MLDLFFKKCYNYIVNERESDKMINFEILLAIYNTTVNTLDNNTKEVYYNYLDKITEKE